MSQKLNHMKLYNTFLTKALFPEIDEGIQKSIDTSTYYAVILCFNSFEVQFIRL